MTEHSLDLYSASEVHNWEVKMRAEGWTTQDFFDHFQQLGSPIALFRSLKYSSVRKGERVAYDIQTCNAIIKTTDQPNLRYAAQAKLLWRLASSKNKNAGVTGSVVQFEDLVAGMDVLLNLVRSSPERGEFALEAEYHIIDAMVDRDKLLDTPKILEHANTMLMLAQSLSDYFVSHAYDTKAFAQYFNMNFLDCLNDSQAHLPFMEQAGYVNLQAMVFNQMYCHVNLLNLKAALTALEVTDSGLSQDYRDAYSNYYKMIYGAGGFAYDFEATQQKTGIMTNLCGALQRILEVHQLVPTKQNFARRRQLLGEGLLQVSSRMVKITQMDVDFENWLKAYLNFKSEKYSLAQHFLQKIGTPKEQDLHTRTVVAGLKLELAAVVGQYEVELVDETVQELVAAYDFAASISPTNGRNYLKLLHRWFPVATSMLHYFHPSLDIEPYKQAVVNFNHQNMAYGIPLPMNFCLEVLLREVLGREEAISPPPLNGDMIRDREGLFVEFEEIRYFRMPITCFKLIYLLAKSKVENRDTLIQVVLEEYGLPRKMKTKYENFLVEKSLGLIQQLASGEITPREFEYALVLLA